jgi:hypothetical protein
MTPEEFKEAMRKAIEELPGEFKEFVISFSWDSGHSSGYEEVVGIASSLASDLLPYIKKFQKRITNG